MRLDPRDLQLLADLVADRLADRLGHTAASPALVDASEIARRTGLSRATIYERADELGALRIGDGPRPRLRFDPDRVAEVLTRRQEPSPPAPLSRPPIRLRRRSPRPLLSRQTPE